MIHPLSVSPVRFSLWVLLVALLVPLAGCSRSSESEPADGAERPIRQARTYDGPDDVTIAPAIRTRLGAGDVPFDEDRLGPVRAFYSGRDFQPVWTGNSDALGRTAALLEMVANADDHALNPGQYALQPVRDALRAAYQEDAPADSVRARRLAEADLLLTDLFFTFGHDLANGPFSPSAVADDWHVADPDVDIAAALQRAAEGQNMDDVLTQLASQHAGYRQLQGAIRRYEEIGSFPTVPEGDVLEEGDRSARVIALRLRLAAENGSLAEQDSVFDGRLVAALARFQERHGLAVDSVLGPNTVEALNVPVEDRIRQIRANLVRWQWLPNDLGGRYIFVNLPEYRLHAYDGGEEVLTMGVIVGEEYDDRATPIFSDSMTYAEFRPYWNIPPSIAEEEIVPKALEDFGYMEANGYEIVRTYGVGPDETLPVTAANLRAVADGTYRMRQEPGSENALGLVKYMFPNTFAIYLHDTPADHLFDERERAFSHGCIRVEDPPALGAYVFEQRGWTEEDIARKMQESPPSQRVDVAEAIPVFILYLTAFVDEDGTLQFRDDLYGYDEPIVAALERQEVEAPGVDVDALVDLLPE